MAGPPKQVTFQVQDTGSGLAEILVTVSQNADTVVPPFTVGTTSAVTVTSTKINQSQPMRIEMRLTDLAGNVTFCGYSDDNVLPNCNQTLNPGPPQSATFTIEDNESGLAEVLVTQSENADTVVPPFTVGSTDPLIVTSTKIDQTRPMRITIRITDVSGNVSTCTLDQTAAISVAKSGPSAAAPGSFVDYTLTVTNASLVNAAQNVVMSDAVPAGTTPIFLIQTGGPPAALSFGGGVFSATFDTLAPGATATFVMRVNVDPGVTHGTIITNTATVTSPWDVTPADNTATVQTVVNALTDISVAKTADQSEVLPGSDIAYTVTVANAGPNSGNNVVLTDAIPAGTTFVSAQQTSGPGFTLITPAVGGTGPITATAATLATGATATFRFVVRVDPGVAPGTVLTNTATVSLDNESAAANNTATVTTLVTALAELSIAKTHSGGFVEGGSGSYSIVVSNVGDGPTSGTVTVTDTLPAGLTATSIGGTGWSCSLPTLTCTRSDVLNAGGSYPPIVLSVNVGVVAGTTVINTANVSGGGGLLTNNGTATDTVEVAGLVAVPTVSEWGLILLGLGLAFAAMRMIRS